MYCKKCGKEVIGKMELCVNCQPNKRVICPNCRKETSMGRGFCQHCEGYLTQNLTQNATLGENLRICSFCGKPTTKSGIYCLHCGKSTQSCNNGSFWLGFLLVWFSGIIGFIIAYAMEQSGSWGSETWRGAKVCFKLILIILVATLVIVGVLSYTALIEIALVNSFR